MQTKNPHYQSFIADIFEQAAFIKDVGIELVEVGPGWCETALILQPKHLQQDGIVHAGVQATMADHTAGAAGGTLVGEDEWVLTIEFKINLLRAAKAERLLCRAEVLKPGRKVTVVESQVSGESEGAMKLVSKATVTLAVLKRGA
jgi:uncharacterized protein (TIGR00369 family)